MRERYEAMSDAELIEDLRSNLPDRSWTLGQMMEVERRGLDSIASDEELHSAVTEAYTDLQERIRTAFEPMAERIRGMAQLSARWKELSTGLSTIPGWNPPKVRLPSVGSIEAIAPASWDELHVNDADLEPIVDRLAGDAARQAEQDERLLVVQVEQLETLKEVRIEAARWNQHDWFDWLVLVAAVIAAVAGIVALLPS